MRNPAGAECPWFYGDYYRGRNTERCDLLGADWQPDLCARCPIPAIHQANACPHMRLQPRIHRDWRHGFRRGVTIEAWCEKTTQPVQHPQVGCGQCHKLPSVFYWPNDDTDLAS